MTFSGVVQKSAKILWGGRSSIGEMGADEQPEDVREVHAGQNAFAFLRTDSSVVTFGNRPLGGLQRGSPDFHFWAAVWWLAVLQLTLKHSNPQAVTARSTPCILFEVT